MSKIRIAIFPKLNLTVLLMTLFTSSGLFYVFDQVYQRILFAITISVLVVELLFVDKLYFRKRSLLLLLYYGFLCSFFVDAILFRSFDCIIYGISMLFVLIIADCIFSRLGNLKNLTLLCNFNILFTAVLIILCIVKVPLQPMMYRGILGNPNTLGIAVGELFVFALARQAEYLRKSLALGKLEWLCIIISLLISAFTSCRTAVLSEMLCFSIFLAYGLKNGTHVAKKRITIFVSVIAFFLAWAYVNGVFDNLFLFTKQSTIIVRNGNIGNGRFEMWELVWNATGLFGNGKTVYHFPAHNIYFGLMNQFGKVNGILFFAFVIEFFRRSIKHSFRKIHTQWELLPALCSAYFFVASMTENYMMTAPMVAMFISMPLIIDRDFRYRKS